MRGIYDLCVVGAGPAGALTALLLARSRPDLAIALLDAEPRPRSRACGEFLAPAGVRVLEAAGIALTGGQRLDGLVLAHGRRRVRLTHAADDGHGLGIRRDELDAALCAAAAQAGAGIVRPARLRALARDGSLWRLDTSAGACAARVLIGADGRHSRVRHALGLDGGAQRWRIGLMARVRGLAPSPDGPVGEMHLGALGQVGVAPQREGFCTINVLLSEAARAALARLGPARLLRAGIAAIPALAARAGALEIGRVHASSQLLQRARAPVAAGAALVGDAAGSFDPITGDGIAQALRQAAALAACLAGADVHGGMPVADWKPYLSRWRELTRVKRLGWLTPLIARRALCAGAVGVLAHSAMARAVLRRLVA